MIRYTQQVPDGGIVVTEPGKAYDSTEFHGYAGDGANGRCLTYINTPGTVYGCGFIAGNDDAFGLVGKCASSIIAHCSFPVTNWKPAATKALILYTNDASSATPGPIYGADVGFAGQFIRNDFGGGSIRIRDGVWNFIGGDITISHLYGIDMVDPTRANLIGVNFRKIPMPPGAGYWTGVPVRLFRHGKNKAGETTYLRTGLKSRLFIKDCTINGVAAHPMEICPGVPASVFSKTFIEK